MFMNDLQYMRLWQLGTIVFAMVAAGALATLVIEKNGAQARIIDAVEAAYDDANKQFARAMAPPKPPEAPWAPQIKMMPVPLDRNIQIDVAEGNCFFIWVPGMSRNQMIDVLDAQYRDAMPGLKDFAPNVRPTGVRSVVMKSNRPNTWVMVYTARTGLCPSAL